MGTEITARRKMDLVNHNLTVCSNLKADIDTKGFIGEIMMELGCTHRTARELLQALIVRFPYTEEKLDGKKIYKYTDSTDAVPNTE